MKTLIRKLLVLLIACTLVVGAASASFGAATKLYGRVALTGGTKSVDNIAYAGLADGDICITVTSGDIVYFHRYESSSSASESSPAVIAPDDAGGNGRWLWVTLSGAGAFTTIDGAGVLTIKPDGTYEVFQVNDGFVDFTDGNNGTSGTLTIDSSGNISYNKNFSVVSFGASGILTGGVGTVTDNDGFTMSAAQGLGYVVYATGAGEIVMPPVVAGSNFSVECHTAGAVKLNPDASDTEDTIRLDGVALSIGDSITSGSAVGDIAVCTYYAADIWSCVTNNWSDTN